MFLEVPIMIHYWAPITSVNYFFVLQAMRLWNWHRSGKMRQLRLWLVPLLAPVALVASLYIWLKSDDPSAWYKRRTAILEQLKKTEGEHVIIVSYGPEHFFHQEWVQNHADIDAAKVVWARDMDVDQNCKLVEYFRRRQIWSLQIDVDQSMPALKPYPTGLCNGA
jgi:hypothetical protein